MSAVEYLRRVVKSSITGPCDLDDAGIDNMLSMYEDAVKDETTRNLFIKSRVVQTHDGSFTLHPPKK